ncbi:MAG: hypothetical protein IJE05_00965 [Clostridia bacterium]|nr:hypothetical protein [Clostridia bacterium]
MKKSKGITMVSLVITIIILVILASISIVVGNNVIKKSELENLKTNMLLIKVKGEEYIEKANFNLGTTIDTVAEEEKNNRIQKAKEELKGEEILEESVFNGNINITVDNITTDNANYIYYYKLTTQNLIDIGLSNVESDEKNGWYIIKYDIKNVQVEVYNTKGFEKEETKYYSLSEIQDLNI